MINVSCNCEKYGGEADPPLSTNSWEQRAKGEGRRAKGLELRPVLLALCSQLLAVEIGGPTYRLLSQLWKHFKEEEQERPPVIPAPACLLLLRLPLLRELELRYLRRRVVSVSDRGT